MPDTREKLIELLHRGVRCPGTVSDCGDCPYRNDTEVGCDEFGATADMLIANGVTIEDLNPVTVRLLEIIGWMRFILLVISMTLGFWLAYALVWQAFELPLESWSLWLLLAAAGRTEWAYIKSLRE
jgi:hypothetical protein